MATAVKQRVTVSLAERLVEALDRAPGRSRSQKIERLLNLGLAAQAQRRWVRELEAFYAGPPEAEEQAEERDWKALAADWFERDD